MFAWASEYFSNQTWYRGFGNVAPAPWRVTFALGGWGSVIELAGALEVPADVPADVPLPTDGDGLAAAPQAAARSPVAIMTAPRRRVRSINVSSSAAGLGSPAGDGSPLRRSSGTWQQLNCQAGG